MRRHKIGLYKPRCAELHAHNDEKFCGQMSDMFSGLMRRSTLISRENEKQP